MTGLDLEKVLQDCQLVIYQETLRQLVEEGKLQSADLFAAIDAATEKLKLNRLLK
jgi:hypothetical protein